MSESVEFRAPRDGMRALTAPLGELSRRIRALEGAAPLKQAGVRGRPGLLSSLDFDGDGTHADLGTQGWMLGDGGGGPSFLDLNGVDVYASLSAQIATLTAQQATLTAQQATLTAQNAQILALIGQQIAGDAQSNNTGGTGVALGTSATDYAPVTFTVPPGFTRATVSGTTGILYAGVNASISAQVNISGALGFTQSGLSSWSNLFNANVANLTGLTSGGTFSVSSRVWRLSTGSVDAYIITTATVTFLR